jgi:hypothetical protein
MPYTPGVYATSPGCMALSQGAVGSCVAANFPDVSHMAYCGAGAYAGGMTGGKTKPEISFVFADALLTNSLGAGCSGGGGGCGGGGGGC